MQQCYLNHLLFPFYPTEVSLVRNQDHAHVLRVFDQLRLLEIVRIYNGLAHIYTRLYPAGIINKVVFDIDAPDIETAIQDMASLASVFEEERLPYVIVFSGRKGFHVYLLTKMVKIDKSMFRIVLKSVVDYYADAAQLRHLDAQTGYGNGWIRLPNTIHIDSGRYATYVESYMVSAGDVYEYSQRPRCPDLSSILGREPPDPREYVALADLPEYLPKPLPEIRAPELESVAEYLRRVVRPCIALHSLHDNPSHFIRTQLATELCWLWHSPQEICDIIEKLRWTDYSRRVTCYHVNKICDKVKQGLLHPASCHTLRERGYCIADKCPFYPRYWSWWLHLA